MNIVKIVKNILKLQNKCLTFFINFKSSFFPFDFLFSSLGNMREKLFHQFRLLSLYSQYKINFTLTVQYFFIKLKFLDVQKFLPFFWWTFVNFRLSLRRRRAPFEIVLFLVAKANLSIPLDKFLWNLSNFISFYQNLSNFKEKTSKFQIKLLLILGL